MIQRRRTLRRPDVIPFTMKKRYRRLLRPWIVPGILACVLFAVAAYDRLQITNFPVIHSFAPSSYRVIDGDTIQGSDGVKYRLLGYDTPETYQARCVEELARGNRATARLKELLRSGDVRLIESGSLDRYGRSLAHLTVNGSDVGQILINEGLARPYNGGRREAWCN